MELYECYRIKSKFLDKNNNDKILRKKGEFNIRVIEVFPFSYSDESNDYLTVVKIQRLIDGKESIMDLYTLTANYY
jgi:hypothetical protein